MTNPIRIAAAQRPPLPVGTPLQAFADDVRRTVDEARADLVVYPELHLFGTEPGPGQNDELRRAAVPLSHPLVAELGAIARDAGVWLVPGSICEAGPEGELFNTALVFAPDGELVASYRKVFPWRPFEPYDPGDRFVTFDIPDVGRFGLSICYDAWFPESTRHLAWQGADVVLNIVKTTTPDRAQELILARANAIQNQVFMVSVNCAGPEGRGRSIVVDPEGDLLAEDDGAGTTTLTALVDPEAVARVRRDGTAGTNRMWSQFRPGDPPIPLPLYDGRIDPARWSPTPSPVPSPAHESEPAQ
jgi:predicted amidohydrolase